MVLAQQLHGHELDVGVFLGTTSLRVLLLGVVSLVAGYVLLRPFLADYGARPRWISAAAGAGILLSLLLATGTTMPRQALALLVVGAVVPIYATWRESAPAGLPRAAPFVLAAAGVGAAALFVRGLLDGAGPEAVPALYDGLVLALLGLSWYPLCGHRSRSGAVSSTGAWLLAAATVAGAGQVAMLTLAGG